MKIAAIQMVSGVDVQQNLREVGRLLELAKAHGAALALLPENFACFGASRLGSLAAEEDHTHDVQQQLAYLAQQYSMGLVLGTLPGYRRPQGEVCGEGKVRAMSWFMDASGQVLARYDKIHLFDALVDDHTGQYRESDYFEPGDSVVTVDYLGVRFGLSVCYDLRFPSLYQALFQAGAQVMLVPSAFTQVTGHAHWQVLLQARAIETQAYVVGANQGGDHGDGRRTYGHSMIVDPWGQVVGSTGEGASLVCAEIDLEHVQRVRRRMPLQSHARFNVSLA